jgi:hypothetical protein
VAYALALAAIVVIIAALYLRSVAVIVISVVRFGSRAALNAEYLHFFALRCQYRQQGQISRFGGEFSRWAARPAGRATAAEPT